MPIFEKEKLDRCRQKEDDCFMRKGGKGFGKEDFIGIDCSMFVIDNDPSLRSRRGKPGDCGGGRGIVR